MRRIAHALALVATLALLASACASDKDTGLPAGPTEAPSAAVCTGEIEMNDELKFVPENCTIKVGTTVTRPRR
jgi:plastocyanin